MTEGTESQGVEHEPPENIKAILQESDNKHLVGVICDVAEELEKRGQGDALRAVMREYMKANKKNPLTVAEQFAELINGHEALKDECPVSNIQTLIDGIDAILAITISQNSERAFVGHRMVKILHDTIVHKTGVLPVQVFHDVGRC